MSQWARLIAQQVWSLLMFWGQRSDMLSFTNRSLILCCRGDGLLPRWRIYKARALQRHWSETCQSCIFNEALGVLMTCRGWLCKIRVECLNLKKKKGKHCDSCSERLFVLLIGLINGLWVNQEILMTSKHHDRERLVESLPADSQLLPCFEEPNPKLELTSTIE